MSSQVSFADTTSSGLSGWQSDADNNKLWSSYCSDTGAAPSIPKVNYNDPLVKAASEKLKSVSRKSYYLYGDIVRVYGLKTGKIWNKVAGLPKGVSLEANAFLVYLCGEFRDRATMIQEKLTWITKLNKVPVGKQAPIDLSKPLWQQVAAESYATYLEFSSKLWSARQREIGQNTLTIPGANPMKVDSPVPALTICENKHIFSEFIAQGREFSDLKNYKDSLKVFLADEKNCSTEDKEYYNSFRGDTNFKPYSPESNGMIWTGTGLANDCATPSTAIVKANKKSVLTDADCKDYFMNPFRRRWEGARASAGAWLLYPAKYLPQFGNQNSPMVVYATINAQNGPFAYSFSPRTSSKEAFDPSKMMNERDPEFEKLQSNKSNTAFASTDMGFNSVFNLKPDSKDKTIPFQRLRNAVNRHTNWYSSGYDDGRSKIMPDNFSPFVATSYEMNLSNEFVNCGVTVPCAPDADDRKHWMFVFRIKKENWYNSERVAKGDPVDFSKYWYDENSLGTDPLAKKERAWDRLGTPVEGEYEAILYLHNITRDGDVTADSKK